MTSEKVRLTRDLMSGILARRLQPGWLVNLGVGMPTRVPIAVDPAAEITFTSENGLIGYGGPVPFEDEDPDLSNAGGEPVALYPGGAILHHADSFALIRRGMNEVSILGAYEVAADGSFANWRTTAETPFDHLGGIGGAMDLAACAQQIWIAMEHTTRDGRPRLLERCTLPVTAPSGATLVVTDIAVVAIQGGRFVLEEHAPGWTADEIQALTGAPLAVSPDLREMRF